jgi:hypothetical protein
MRRARLPAAIAPRILQPMKTKPSRALRAARVDPEVCIETFVDAADVVGGCEQLAKTLRVPAQLLSSWMEGLEVPPHAFYLRAVELLRQAAPVT